MHNFFQTVGSFITQHGQLFGMFFGILVSNAVQIAKSFGANDRFIQTINVVAAGLAPVAADYSVTNDWNHALTTGVTAYLSSHGFYSGAIKLFPSGQKSDIRAIITN